MMSQIDRKSGHADASTNNTVPAGSERSMIGVAWVKVCKRYTARDNRIIIADQARYTGEMQRQY